MEQAFTPSQATSQLLISLAAITISKMIPVMIMATSLRKGNPNSTTLKVNATWLKALLIIF